MTENDLDEEWCCDDSCECCAGKCDYCNTHDYVPSGLPLSLTETLNDSGEPERIYTLEEIQKEFDDGAPITEV